METESNSSGRLDTFHFLEPENDDGSPFDYLAHGFPFCLTSYRSYGPLFEDKIPPPKLGDVDTLMDPVDDLQQILQLKENERFDVAQPRDSRPLIELLGPLSEIIEKYQLNENAAYFLLCTLLRGTSLEEIRYSRFEAKLPFKEAWESLVHTSHVPYTSGTAFRELDEILSSEDKPKNLFALLARLYAINRRIYGHLDLSIRNQLVTQKTLTIFRGLIYQHYPSYFPLIEVEFEKELKHQRKLMKLEAKQKGKKIQRRTNQISVMKHALSKVMIPQSLPEGPSCWPRAFSLCVFRIQREDKKIEDKTVMPPPLETPAIPLLMPPLEAFNRALTHTMPREFDMRLPSTLLITEIMTTGSTEPCPQKDPVPNPNSEQQLKAILSHSVLGLAPGLCYLCATEGHKAKECKIYPLSAASANQCATCTGYHPGACKWVSCIAMPKKEIKPPLSLLPLCIKDSGSLQDISNPTVPKETRLLAMTSQEDNDIIHEEAEGSPIPDSTPIIEADDLAGCPSQILQNPKHQEICELREKFQATLHADKPPDQTTSKKKIWSTHPNACRIPKPEDFNDSRHHESVCLSCSFDQFMTLNRLCSKEDTVAALDSTPENGSSPSPSATEKNESPPFINTILVLITLVIITSKLDTLWFNFLHSGIIDPLIIQAVIAFLLTEFLRLEDDRKQDKDIDISLTEGTKPFIPILVNNHQYLALYDTGASSCFIHPAVLEKAFGRDIPIEAKPGFTLNDFQGQAAKTRIEGQVLLDIIIGNGILVRRVPFLLVRSLFHVILGMNLFQARQWNTIWENNKLLIVPGKDSMPIEAILKPPGYRPKHLNLLMTSPKKKRRKNQEKKKTEDMRIKIKCTHLKNCKKPKKKEINQKENSLFKK